MKLKEHFRLRKKKAAIRQTEVRNPEAKSVFNSTSRPRGVNESGLFKRNIGEAGG